MKFKDELSQADRFIVQLEVPHSVYGATTYFVPGPINTWLKERNLQADYVGCHSSGNGYTGNVNNSASVYVIRRAHDLDGLALRIMFSDCKVVITERYGYV